MIRESGFVIRGTQGRASAWRVAPREDREFGPYAALLTLNFGAFQPLASGRSGPC